MKIILTAFGRMQSDIMDIPDNSTPIWKMRLHKPVTAISGYNGNKIADRPSFETECEFEWTGKVEFNSGARIYDLVDIIRF